MVQGHVDGTGTVRSVEREGMASVVSIAADPDLLRYVVEKGSIAVDGVSLHRVRSHRGRLHRLARARDPVPAPAWAPLAPGDTVNLEVDVLAKYVEKLVAR